jgi:hypothetical protein
MAGVALAGAAAVQLLAPGTALAHERRQVGPYTLVVGFASEPAIQNQVNGASIRISRTDGGTPVEGADKTLKVSLAAGGGQPKEFPLRAVFGQPGLYQADFIPSKSGSYIFTFAGTLEGTAVNERFESGPGRFNDVDAVDKLLFPEAASTAQLADQVKDAQDRAAAAESKVGQAQTAGIAGVVLGVIGLGTGAAALMAARRSSPPPAPRTAVAAN